MRTVGNQSPAHSVLSRRSARTRATTATAPPGWRWKTLRRLCGSCALRHAMFRQRDIISDFPRAARPGTPPTIGTLQPGADEPGAIMTTKFIRSSARRRHTPSHYFCSAPQHGHCFAHMPGWCMMPQLYALQALAALRPEVFSGDIFLKYGSQNDFTFFPRIYALLVGAIGLERATALLTLTCSIALACTGLVDRPQAVEQAHGMGGPLPVDIHQGLVRGLSRLSKR